MTTPTHEATDVTRIAADFARMIVANAVRNSGTAAANMDVASSLRVEPTEVKSAQGGVRVTCAVAFEASKYIARHNAVTGEQLRFYFDALARDSSEALAPETCLDAATKVANPPADAVLVSAQYESQGGVGRFAALWHHYHDGVRVEEDKIYVLVNGTTGRVFLVSRNWRDIGTGYSTR